MKAIKQLVITSAIAAGLAGSASATPPVITPGNTVVTVHVVGAPAFRQPVNDAIEAVIESYPASQGAGLTATGATTVPAVGSRSVGSSIEGAKTNQWIIPNFSSGTDLVITASYSGSAAGIESVASLASATPKTQKFILPADAIPANVTSPLTNVSGTDVESPDTGWITNSDTFPSTTLFTGSPTFNTSAARPPATISYNFTSLVADLGQTAPGTTVAGVDGVEVYHWVASPNAPSDFTNITTAQAKALYTSATGSLPLSFFTGVASDESTIVYALSRDPGSGARAIALAEIGIQPPGTNGLIQTVVPTINGTGAVVDNQTSYVGGTITAIATAPAGVVPSTGIYAPAGDTGYASFGTTTNGGSTSDSSTSSNNHGLLQAITATPPANTIFVTYLDNDDTNEALAVSSGASGAFVPPSAGGSSKLLSFNGVTAGLVDGALDPVVTEGQYDFWSYESFYSVGSAGNQEANSQTFEGDLLVAFRNFSTLAPGDLRVKRSADGGPLSKTY